MHEPKTGHLVERPLRSKGLLATLGRSFGVLGKTILWEPFHLLWRYRKLLWQTVVIDIKTRYAGSVLGLFWLFIYPLLFLSAYALVYIYIFQVRFPNPEITSVDYTVLIFCGLIPFLGFSESISLGVPSVVSNVSLMKNTLFPIDLIPVKAVMVGQSTQLVGMGLLLVAVTLLGNLSAHALLIVPIWFLQTILTTGLVWIFSSLNVYVRDIQNMVAIAVLLLMMLSPIAYTEEMLSGRLRSLLMLNPLYYVIEAYRSVLMYGEFPSAQIMIPLVCFSLFSFVAGYWFFGRIKVLFSDYV
ncbi:MAG: ABC transporter permease [Phormidesmis sp.]